MGFFRKNCYISFQKWGVGGWKDVWNFSENSPFRYPDPSLISANPSGRRLTHYLLIQGSNECMSLLLRAGAEIATVNNSGDTLWGRLRIQLIFLTGTTLTHNDISFSRQVRSGLGSRPHANGRFPRDRRKPRHRWVSWHRQRLGHPRLKKKFETDENNSGQF